jgi:enoyl-CoA hydratase/carnithine racemase
MYETLTVHREEHLTWLTLDRPDALNAMSATLVRELRQFFWELPADTERPVMGSGR